MCTSITSRISRCTMIFGLRCCDVYMYHGSEFQFGWKANYVKLATGYLTVNTVRRRKCEWVLGIGLQERKRRQSYFSQHDAILVSSLVLLKPWPILSFIVLQLCRLPVRQPVPLEVFGHSTMLLAAVCAATVLYICLMLFLLILII